MTQKGFDWKPGDPLTNSLRKRSNNNLELGCVKYIDQNGIEQKDWLADFPKTPVLTSYSSSLGGSLFGLIGQEVENIKDKSVYLGIYSIQIEE